MSAAYEKKNNWIIHPRRKKFKIKSLRPPKPIIRRRLGIYTSRVHNAFVVMIRCLQSLHLQYLQHCSKSCRKSLRPSLSDQLSAIGNIASSITRFDGSNVCHANADAHTLIPCSDLVQKNTKATTRRPPLVRTASKSFVVGNLQRYLIVVFVFLHCLLLLRHLPLS